MKQQSIYDELFKRNFPLIQPRVQQKIKALKVLVAGCGSTGGAFIEGASRLGVINFRLTEPDQYELHNLNRQFVYPEDIGKNKAVVHAERLKKFFENCGSEIEVNTAGIDSSNVNQMLENIDVVFDAVDVTTSRGMKAKLLLHERAAEKKLLVFSALDLAFKQWLRFFDYRGGAPALFGKLQAAKDCEHPLKALLVGFCPPSELSKEILVEVLRLIENPGSSACQIAAPCHLLAGFTGPALVRFVEAQSLPSILSFDSMRMLESREQQKLSEEERAALQLQVQEIFAALK